MKNKKGLPLMMAGLLLVAAALCLCGYNIYDSQRAGETARQAAQALQAALPEEETETLSLPGEEMIPDYVLNPGMDMPHVIVDGEAYIGLLEIPALGLTLPVMEEWSYPRLQLAPCRYSGSVYAGNMVVVAHNYRAHFGRLTELSPGDMVYFTDVDGHRFAYTMEAREVVAPTSARELKESGWALVLFTCTADGRSRTAVYCSPAEG